MKVGMDDPSSVEFVERRRAALERQGSVHLSNHSSQDHSNSFNYTEPVLHFVFCFISVNRVYKVL